MGFSVLKKRKASRIQEIGEEQGAFLRGHFRLSSGAKSDYYFEAKRITLSPEGAYEVGQKVFELVSEAGVEAVGGAAIGADPIATAVALISHLRGKPIPAFIVRKEPKQHGAERLVEGNLREGSRVAIVDDVLTTGGSVIRAIEAVEALGCKVVKVVVILDREEGGSVKLRRLGYDVTAILAGPQLGLEWEGG